jgi:hypothetical protein
VFIECWQELSTWIQQYRNSSNNQQPGPRPFSEADHNNHPPSGDDSVWVNATIDRSPDTQLNALLKWYLNPGQLTSVIAALPSVRDQEWLDAACINLPLCLLALQNKCHVRYVPLEFHHPQHTLEEIEILRYRALFNRHHEIKEHSWICTLINKGDNHWFGLLGHPQRRQVFVLGREMAKSTVNILHSWQEWGGPQIWSTICKLHDWDSTVESVQSINWQQNGHDCGPDIAHILTTFMTYGVTPTNTGMVVIPTIPCGHSFRISAGKQLLDYAKKYVKQFVNVCERNRVQAASVEPEWQQTYEEYRRYLDHWAKHPQWPVKKALKRLERHAQTCASCLLPSRTASSAMPSATRFTEMKEARLHPGILADTRTATSPSDNGGGQDLAEGVREEEEKEEDGHTDSDGDSEEEGGGEQDKGAVEDVDLKDLGGQDTSPASAPRFGRPHKAPMVPTFDWKPGEWNKRHTHFDEYADGPVLANLAPGREDAIYAPQNVYNMAANSGNIGPEWRTEYGWRLLPDYAEIFPQQSPCDVDAHLMPVLPVDPLILEPIQGLSRGRGGKAVSTTDAVDLSLLEMIQHADSVGSKEIFVTGRKGLEPNSNSLPAVPWEENKPPLVRVMIHKDECQLKEGVQMTTDIDSGIWITRRPNFKLRFSILLGPLYSSMRKPPIWKHNHLYVKLLVPQLEEDRARCLKDPERPDRKEYWVKEFRLSQIPHISLGQDNQVFLHIFFPRLTHKRPGSRFYASMVPYHVQLTFFKELLLPTLFDEVLDDPEKVYTSLSQEHLQFQNASTPKLCPLRPDQWEKLVEIIHKKVCHYDAVAD